MNQLSKEAIEAIEQEVVNKTLSTYGGIYFKEGATEALTNPEIYEKGGLISFREGMEFGMWCSVHVKGIMNDHLCMMHDGVVAVLPDLFQIYKQQKL